MALGGILEELGVDADTLTEAEAAYQDLAGAFETGSSAYNEVMGLVGQGEATLQQLGLLDAPEGAPKGGRWGFDESGAPMYMAPSDVRFGKPVSQWPAWVPLGDSEGEAAIRSRLMLLMKLGGGEAEAQAIGVLDPMSGVAAAGTSFDSLAPEEKRAYLANARVIGILKNYTNPMKASAIVLELNGQEKGLGFCDPRTDQCGHDYKSVQSPTGVGRVCEGRPFASDGRPLINFSCDFDEATRRLFALSKGIQPAALQTYRDTGQQMFVGAEGVPATGDWKSCFNLDHKEKVKCIEGFLGQPGVKDEILAEYKPWEPPSDPEKRFEFIDGIDDHSWTKIKIFGKDRAFRTVVFIPVVIGATLAAGVGGYSLWKIFRGKKKRRRRRRR